MNPRDLNREYQDTADRKYAYEFDAVVRTFMMRTFEPHMTGGPALELGCYKGEFTQLLAARYQDLTVVEGASDLVAEARAAVGDRATFVHASFETVEFERTFDAIFLVHTLEHLDDPVGILRRIRTWLGEHGRLFLVVPNAHAASRQIAVHMGLMSDAAAVTDGEARHGHRRTYALDTLERDAREAGLSVLQRGGIFFKALANFQMDRAMDAAIISDAYLEGCYALGMKYPDLCASIYLVCGNGS